jgi:peptidoglycan/xylan/chitin deacetylase (PgdA/CDA1 family)
VNSKPGTLIISLDFELLWGIRDFAGEKKAESILLTRQVVPRLLELFQKYGVHATWAIVGFLFFASRSELLAALPKQKPNYVQCSLSPYENLTNELGENEEADPLHFAPSLIRRIMQVPYQELATHTFSHYYCLEEGQALEDFEHDLQAALQAASPYGYKIQSIIFPRNQYGDSYLEACGKNNILAYRGTESVWFRQSRNRQAHGQWYRRLMRLTDAYVNISGANTYPIPSTIDRPVNLPSSRYLRPYSKKLEILEPLRLKRILTSLSNAAQAGEVFHLWWHPEDFSENIEDNLRFLEAILKHYQELHRLYGMQSRSMGEVARGVIGLLK